MLEKKDNLEEILKRTILQLSDNISSQLNILFNCKFSSKKILKYDEFIQMLDRRYYVFSLRNEKVSPLLNVLDAQIIYMLTNRMLGGEGILEVRKFKDLFSFSERYFAKYLIDWLIESMHKNGLMMNLGKIADSPKYYHIYLSDEEVWQYTFEVYIAEQHVGLFYLCIDRDFEIKLLKDIV